MMTLVLQGRPLLATAADARLFVNRAEELAQLERSVRRGFNVALYGDRGVGKSSLLHHLEYREREARRVAFVDAGGVEDISMLVQRVAVALGGRPSLDQAALARTNVALGLAAGSTPGDASSWLAEQVRAFGDIAPTVILVDASAAPEAAYDLFGRLRDELWQLDHRWIVSVDTDDWHLLNRPPADAFFDITIEVPPFDESLLIDLLTLREPELDEHELAQVVMGSDGNPRLALELVRQTLIRERPVDEILVARAIREQAASRLGRPHGMLLAELERSGEPLSPSDERLLERMGWTRERAGQVFRDLEEARIVASVEEPQIRGRPRKLYFPAPQSMRQLKLLSELRGAIDSGNIVISYQPITDCDLQVRGAEAVIHWQHPEFGLLPAAEFIPTVESTALIGLLTRYVLERSIADCAGWRDTGNSLSVAVSALSVRNLLDRNLPREIAGLLSTYELPARALQLEISESILNPDPDGAIATVANLGEQGVRISVADFGTGYSSLATLRRLPIDELRIDKSFISEMLNDDHALIIVRSTINLGHDLGLNVAAAGVEDKETLERLAALGCDLAQGGYVGQPTSSEVFVELTRSNLDLKLS